MDGLQRWYRLLVAMMLMAGAIAGAPAAPLHANGVRAAGQSDGVETPSGTTETVPVTLPATEPASTVTATVPVETPNATPAVTTLPGTGAGSIGDEDDARWWLAMSVVAILGLSALTKWNDRR